MAGPSTERLVKLEQAWYEGSPYVYAVTGVASAADAANSLLMSGSATLLVGASLTILAFRWMHRHDRGGTGDEGPRPAPAAGCGRDGATGRPSA